MKQNQQGNGLADLVMCLPQRLLLRAAVCQKKTLRLLTIWPKDI